AMALVTIRDLTIRYRGPALLDGVSCQIERGQHIGLLGRNGSGKTTLMRLLQGQVEPDAGEVVWEAATRVSLLPQDVPRDIAGAISEVVAQGLPASGGGEHDHDHGAGWKRERRVEQILSRMKLDGDARFETLSS